MEYKSLLSFHSYSFSLGPLKLTLSSREWKLKRRNTQGIGHTFAQWVAVWRSVCLKVAMMVENVPQLAILLHSINELVWQTQSPSAKSSLSLCHYSSFFFCFGHAALILTNGLIVKQIAHKNSQRINNQNCDKWWSVVFECLFTCNTLLDVFKI